jgi:tripartite-type tricarboxylate transporter receptor subunit TctC
VNASRSIILSGAILTALGMSAGQALAQAFPSKPIRIVVPFPAGGSVDALGRLISPKMSEAMGQPVLVENRPGGGAVIGADAVAKAAPDGHTIMLIPNALAIFPALYRKLPFDAARDFAPVSQLIATELVLVGTTKLTSTTLKDMVAQAKANPGKMNYGSTGVANPLHLTMELFKSVAGIEVEAIPYKGDAPINAALMSGELEMSVVPLSGVQAMIKSGKVRALGMTGKRRSVSMPEVLTIAEQGYPGFDSGSWQGLFAPAGTPREIVQRLSAEAVKGLRSPDVLQRLPALGQVPVGSTPDEFEAQFKADIEKFLKVVKVARIPAQD